MYESVVSLYCTPETAVTLYVKLYWNQNKNLKKKRKENSINKKHAGSGWSGAQSRCLSFTGVADDAGSWTTP